MLKIISVCAMTLALGGCLSTRETVGIAGGVAAGALIGSALTQPARPTYVHPRYAPNYRTGPSVVVTRRSYGYGYPPPRSRTTTDYYDDY